MDYLELNKDLFFNMMDWMRPKYSFNSVKQYSCNLKKMFKKYGVLNQETLRKIMKDMKHQNQRACLVMINKYCYDSNIDFHINIPGIKAQPNKIPEILSPQEIKVLIQSCPKPYDLVIRCIFNMGAGLRISEVIKLSWSHIKWADWIDNKDSYGVAMIKGGKGAKDRTVNIPKQLMNDLYSYAEEQKVLNEYGIPIGGMIFPFTFDSEQPFKPDLLATNQESWKQKYLEKKYKWFQHNIIFRCCEKALNKKIHVHMLRHSRATYLYEVEKVPIEQIQVLLGHSNLDTTMIYTRINQTAIFNSLSETKEV